MLILKEEWQSHPKILNAVFLAGSPQVKHFWFELLSSASNGADGIIEPFQVAETAQSCGIDLETARRFLDALLASGTRAKPQPLFHDADSLKNCDACKNELRKAGHTTGPSDVVAHDFLKHNPGNRDKTPLGQMRQKRKNWLARKGKALKLKVHARDDGLCRYCGIRPVDGGDGPRALEHDHVNPDPTLEPDFGNFLANVCISCRGCNQRKGQRTPEEAGMRLLAPGTTAQDVRDGRAVHVDSLDEVRTIEPASGVGGGSGTGRARRGTGSGAGRSRVGAGAPSATRETSRGGPQARSTGVLRPEALPP